MFTNKNFDYLFTKRDSYCTSYAKIFAPYTIPTPKTVPAISAPILSAIPSTTLSYIFSNFFKLKFLQKL